MAILKNSEDMMERFDKLYQKMAVSDNVEHMKLFGSVMRKAMQELANVRPERAEEMLEELCAINWKNYLTRREAEEIVSKMEPQAVWSRDQVTRTLKSSGLPTEEEPYYNEYALWTEISKVYSDNGNTIMSLMGWDKNAAESEKMLEACYKLALDHLKDRDGVYHIRKYFGLA